MFKLAKPLFLLCETPLHVGSGSELGVVDLPIQRERHTDFPKIESSSLKGGIREVFEQPKDAKMIQVGTTQVASIPQDAVYKNSIQLAFGPEEGELHSGSLGFTDARLLLFPVKSMKGVFAWITCPKVLQQFQNDLKLSKIDLDFELPSEKTAPNGCQLFVQGNKIVLEEYTFEITADDNEKGNCSKLVDWLYKHLFPTLPKGQTDMYAYWREKIRTDLVVLTNDDFRDFAMLSTEIITRTKINNTTGTVQQGALFTEEYLPSESVLYSLALTTPIFRKEKSDKGIFHQNGMSEEALVMEFLTNGLPEVMQLGGNATIGKGIVRTHIMEG